MFSTTGSKQGVTAWGVAFMVLLAACCIEVRAQEKCITIHTPGGDLKPCFTHIGPQGDLIAPEGPKATPFRPPSIFSAPLPTGSGARALGIGGAFTAVADDATAASWNPAGLVQLERPEASAVFRVSTERLDHRSEDDDFSVGSDRFENKNLNYFSLVYPFYSPRIRRNIVVSLNYQEAYDFTQRFTADVRNRPGGRRPGFLTETFSDKNVQVSSVRTNFPGGFIESTLFFTNAVSTEISTLFEQGISSEQISFLEFEQEGIIDAITPSFALEITPTLSVGASFNYYQDSPFSDAAIRSRTKAVTVGSLESRTRTTTSRTSSGTYDYGTLTTVQIAPDPVITNHVTNSGVFTPLRSESVSRRTDRIQTEGTLEEFTDMNDLQGYNANVGVLWTVSRYLSLGFSLDLPWTAEAKQTKRLRNTTTTYDSTRTQIIEVTSSEVVERKDVEFTFPLSWAVGMVWRWTPEFYTMIDVSQVLWSDFSFKAEGEERINPLDGSSHKAHPLDDTWSVRLGTEYLLVLGEHQVPLRAGWAWEQRPALGQPDDFYSISLGTGFFIGKRREKTILDFAYALTVEKT